MSDLTKQFESLLADMKRWDVYQEGDEIDNAMLDLKDKIDEAEMRIECARRCAIGVYESIIKYTDHVDNNESFNMSVNDHDAIRQGADDIHNALNFDDNMCIEDNWYNLYNEANGKQINYFKITSHSHKHLEGNTYDVLHSDTNENGHRILELNCRHPEDNNVNLWVNMMDGEVVDTKEHKPQTVSEYVETLPKEEYVPNLQIEIFNELDPIKKERTESDAYIVVGIDYLQWTYNHLRLIVDGTEYDIPTLGKESIYYDGKVWGDFRITPYEPTNKNLRPFVGVEEVPQELLNLFKKDLVV